MSKLPIGTTLKPCKHSKNYKWLMNTVKYSIWLTIREMQFLTSYLWNTNIWNFSGGQCGNIYPNHQNTNTLWPNDSIWIHPKEIIRDLPNELCIRMFIATLFMLANLVTRHSIQYERNKVSKLLQNKRTNNMLQWYEIITINFHKLKML